MVRDMDNCDQNLSHTYGNHGYGHGYVHENRDNVHGYVHVAIAYENLDHGYGHVHVAIAPDSSSSAFLSSSP